jgi:hypothetical protein
MLLGVAFFAVLAGCGGAAVNSPATPHGTPSPTPTPTATPTPNPLVATPANLAFGGVNGSQQISIKETGFTGTLTATSNDTTIVTVAPPSVAVSTAGNPASTGVFVVTSIGIGATNTGTTTITISDGTHTLNVPVTVSVTSGIITYRARKPAGSLRHPS